MQEHVSEISVKLDIKPIFGIMYSVMLWSFFPKGHFPMLYIIIKEIYTMEKLLEILNSVRSDVDFANETKLIDDNILDSFDIVSIVGELCDEYDITITAEDLEPENFNSAAAILALVEKLQDEI